MTGNNRQRYLERRKNKTPIPRKITPPKKDNMSSFSFWMVASFFASIMFFISILYKIDISNFGLFQLLALAMAVGFLIPISMYRKKFTMSFYEYVIFNIISFSPSSISLLFILNLLFHSNSYIETYKVVDVEKYETAYIYILDNEQYQDEEYIRTIYDKDFPNIKGHEYYAIQLADGYFGLRVIENKLAY